MYVPPCRDEESLPRPHHPASVCAATGMDGIVISRRWDDGTVLLSDAVWWCRRTPRWLVPVGGWLSR